MSSCVHRRFCNTWYSFKHNHSSQIWSANHLLLVGGVTDSLESIGRTSLCEVLRAELAEKQNFVRGQTVQILNIVLKQMKLVLFVGNGYWKLTVSIFSVNVLFETPVSMAAFSQEAWSWKPGVSTKPSKQADLLSRQASKDLGTVYSPLVYWIISFKDWGMNKPGINR